MPDVSYNIGCVVDSGGFSRRFGTLNTPITNTVVFEQTVTVPVSAKTTPYVINDVGVVNSEIDHVVAVAINTYASINVTFRTAGGSSLGSNTYEADEAWVTGMNALSWFSFGSGDVDSIEITRLDDFSTDINVSILLAASGTQPLTPPPPNSLLSYLAAHHSCEEILYGMVEDNSPQFGASLTVNGTVNIVPGVRDTDGLDLTGASNYLSHAVDFMGEPYLTRPLLTNPDTSYSFWVRLDSDGTFFETTQNWSNWGGLTGPGHLRIEHDGTGYRASIEWINATNDGAQTWTASLPSLPSTADGAWYHVVITRDNADTLRFYINGVLDATVSVTSFMRNDWQGKGLYFGNGCDILLDEIGIWGKQLSDAAGSDIEDLYNSGDAILLAEYQ